MPPPVPIGELVQKMMSEVDGDIPITTEQDVQLDELPASAQDCILAEIGDAYLRKLGSRGHVPYLRTSPEAALCVPLEHWAGFVLSLVDGRASVEEIVDASSLPEVEALRLLCDLHDQGLIAVRLGRAAPRPR
jgi:hypothetical protein